jgi:Ca2+-transporting ATPase
MEKGDPDTMDRPPRPTNEPIINQEMRLGMIVQTIAITVVVLIAYWLGMREGEALYGANSPETTSLARTMAFITLSASELFRAYTARSEFFSLFGIGILSNKYMQYAVGVSIILLLSVVYLPFLAPVFDTTPITFLEWVEMLPLILFPSIAAELTKWYMRSQRARAKLAGSVA